MRPRAAASRMQDQREPFVIDAVHGLGADFSVCSAATLEGGPLFQYDDRVFGQYGEALGGMRHF